jgi:hypothetical protein
MLHTVELGLAKLLLGGALHVWCYPNGEPHAPAAAAERCEAVADALQAAYRSLGIEERLGNVLLRMFTDPRSPHASSPELKAHAGEIRHAVPAMAVVACDKADSEGSGHLAQCLSHLARF